MKRTKQSILSGITKEVKSSKFIDNNTLDIIYLDNSRAIRLHDTDVVTFEDNKVVLNSGGWRTPTTKERINRHSGLPHVWQEKGLWYIAGSLFYDGMTFDNSGKLLSGIKESNLKKVNDLKRKIKKFCDLITKDNLPIPDFGDCWYCLLVEKDSKTMGYSFKDNEHLINHIDEGYLHGSLLVNAMRERGYSDKQIGFHYGMKLHETFRRAVRIYLQKRLINDVAVK